MNKITVGFSRSNLIGSKIIALSENRDYSHVFISYRHPVTQEIIICHAANGIVHEVSHENFTQNNEIVKTYEFNIDNGQWVYFHQLNNRFKGSKYSTIQILVLFLLKLVGSKRGVLVNGNRKFICSEWVYFVLSKINILDSTVVSPDTITPSDLERLLNG